jgi:hypothetical protein
MRRSYRKGVLNTLILLLPAVSLVVSGCASTQVKQVWQDESYPPGKLKNVLVLAAAGNPTVQREIESQFAKRFRERGIKVTEGFRVLPVDQLPAHDARGVVVAKMRELGVDSLLLIQRDSGRNEKEYIPGMTIQTGFGYYGGAAVIASSAPTAPSTQGYSHTREFFGMRTLLFDTGTEKVVFFMRTETRVDGPLQEQIKPYVSLVSRKLFSEKLFP